MGSGSLCAMAVFESEYRDDMEVCYILRMIRTYFCQIEDAVALVAKAVAAGVFNDLGSGSNIDVTIITREKTEVRRNFITPNERKHPPAVYYYPPGTTGTK
jgi:20S proteasome subunit beta 2